MEQNKLYENTQAVMFSNDMKHLESAHIDEIILLKKLFLASSLFSRGFPFKSPQI